MLGALDTDTHACGFWTSLWSIPQTQTFPSTYPRAFNTRDASYNPRNVYLRKESLPSAAGVDAAIITSRISLRTSREITDSPRLLSLSWHRWKLQACAERCAESEADPAGRGGGSDTPTGDKTTEQQVRLVFVHRVADLFWVFTQVTQRQNFDAKPGTDWTIFSVLSTGCRVKFDACTSKFLTPASKNLTV